MKKPSTCKSNISQYPVNNGSESGSSSPHPCSSESSNGSSSNSEIQSVSGSDVKHNLDENVVVLDSHNNSVLDYSRHGRKQRVVETLGSDPS